MTRQKILEAAAQIFSHKGYHATSMNDIACAVNLQKASLYHHVTSKQEILVSILDEALDLVASKVGEVVSFQIPANEKLQLAMETYLYILTEQRDLAAVLLLEHRSLNTELHRRHIPRRDRFEQLWRDLLQMGIDEGIFEIQDVDMTARALLGVMNWVVTWYQEGGELSIQEISKLYLILILHGISVRKSEDGG
jgi:AcrR family transcriptional regulator